MRIISIVLFLSGLFNTIQLLAQPDFSRQYPLDSIIVYQDCMDTTHYYYHGSQLQVKTEISGKPNFSFVQSRYTGSQRSGNRGDIRFRSFVQVKVRQHIPGNEQVHKIKGLMAESYNLKEIQLSPLRYKYIAARLICPRIGEDPLISELTFAEDDAGLNHAGEWKEKVFTLALDDFTSQALWEVIQSGRSLLSLEYQMIAEGKTAMTTADSALIEFTQSDSVTKRERLGGMAVRSEASNQVFGEKVVQADAIPIHVDVAKYPDLLKQVDINEQIPPEYPLIQVYCFDFQNQLSESLLLKKVTLQAWGVNQQRVQAMVTFRKTSPDAIFQTANFQHAVLIHKPLRYKITTVDSQSGLKETSWKSWHLYDGILDITLQK